MLRNTSDLASGEPADERCLSVAQIRCQVGLDTALSDIESRYNLHCMMNYVDVCSFRFDLGHSLPAETWWAHFKSVPIARAREELRFADSAIKDIFFTTPPAARAARWAEYAQSVRADVNLLLAISRAVLSELRWAWPPGCERLAHRSFLTYRDIGAGLLHAVAQRGGFEPSETGYLLGLSFKLREHATAIDAWMSPRIDISPGDARRFVLQHIAPKLLPVRVEVPVLTGAHAYASQCREDMTALLLYVARVSGTCMLEPHGGPDLTAIRTHYVNAVASEPVESKVFDRLFLQGADPSAVYHDGRVFRNAAGMDAHGLVQAWIKTGDETFNQFTFDRQLALVRRRMLALEEHPDYRVGDMKQGMANSLLRMDPGLAGPKYMRYANDTALLEAWQARHQQWLERRDFVLSPELHASILGVEAMGIHKTSLSWYQALWDEKILKPIVNHPVMLTASGEDRAILRAWLEQVTVHWHGNMMRWRAVTPEQYADAVLAAADVLYRLQQSENRPRMAKMRIAVATGPHSRDVLVYPGFLDGLPKQIKNALYEVAAGFDVEPFRTERILSEDWLYSALRILNHGHLQAVLAFQTKPLFSVEVQAYIALTEAGVSEEDVGKAGAYIVSATHPLDYKPPVGIAYHKFLEVIRSPRRDDFLVLPGGVRIYPHHVINQAFDDYLEALPSHPWIVGTAKAALRARGEPILPSVLAPEIDKLVAPLRASAAKHTELGTRLGDLWFGQLPITAPLLKMSRAVRDGKYRDVPYYVLLLARDAMSVMALSKAMAAAYFPGLAAGGRLVASSFSSTSQVIRLPPGRSLRDWGAREDVRRKAASAALDLLSTRPPDYKSRSTGPRNQGKAARHFSNADVFRRDHGAGVWGTDRLSQRNWEKLRSFLSPTDSAASVDKLTHVDRRSDQGTFSTAHLAMQSRIEDMGEHTGVFGLTNIDGNTEIAGQPLADRVTVALAYEWLLQAIDRKPRDIQAWMDTHLRLRITNQVAVQVIPPAASGYNVQVILQDLYAKSPLLRAMFNWYDSHALESKGLDLLLDGRQGYPSAIRHYGGFRTEVRIPGNPEEMCAVMKESGFVYLSFKEALVEGIISAITAAAPPAAVASERGVNVLFTNLILLQSGEPFMPRIAAAYFRHSKGREHTRITLTHAREQLPAVRAACEAEDQYLERVSMFNELSIDHLHYQGGPIVDRPTVRGVLRTLERIQYRNAQSDPTRYLPHIRDAEVFHQIFEQWFVLARTDNDTATFTAVRALFWDCYLNSLLFRLLVDQAGVPPSQPWTLQLDRFDGTAIHRHAEMFGTDNVITIAWNGVRYLGLLQEQISGTAEMPASDAGGPSASPAEFEDVSGLLRGEPGQSGTRLEALCEMEPFRRILDGIIAVLTRDALQGIPATSYADRGVGVWVTDMVLWDLGWRLNKRLLRALEVQGDLAVQMQINEAAPMARRAARVEDDYISRWVGRLLPTD